MDTRQQVLMIHGGNAFHSYDTYLEHLQTREIDLERLARNDWKTHLAEHLGPEFQVIFPTMPNKQNAQYLEWKIWFERFIPFLEDGVILVGHSLGGSFLGKYLSGENFPRKIKATFLVAAPYDLDEDGNSREFVVPQSLEVFSKQAGKVYVYHSKDDAIVALLEFEKYKQALPDAHMNLCEGRGHFNQEEFPEIVEELKQLAKQSS